MKHVTPEALVQHLRARRAWLRRAAAGLLALPALAGRAQPGAQALATVAAAADLKFALDELAQRFERERGMKLRIVYGSSGQFTTQILQGAPFHLFLSADEELVQRLVAAGRTAGAGRLYARGRLALLVPQGSPLRADGSLADLAAALADGRLQKFAIANPQHAPYGQRARQALAHAGLWPAIEPRLVYGENVAQAAQFAVAGGAQGGIVALSLARAPQLAGRARFAPIDAQRHAPLLQRMVLLKDAPPSAAAFYDELTTPAAQALLARYGFEPAEPAAR